MRNAAPKKRNNQVKARVEKMWVKGSKQSDTIWVCERN
jgi:hypothetical protein